MPSEKKKTKAVTKPKPKSCFLKNAKIWIAIKTFFSAEGWIARTFKAMKLAVTESQWMKSIKTFFSTEGWIAKNFLLLKTAVTESQWMKSITTFFSADGMIAKNFLLLKTAVTDSTWMKSLTTFFSSKGTIPKAFTEMKLAVTNSTWMKSITHFFSAEGAIASRIAKITAVLRGVGGGAAAGAGKAGAMGIQVAKGIGSGIKAAFTTVKTVIGGFFNAVSTVFKHIRTIKNH